MNIVLAIFFSLYVTWFAYGSTSTCNEFAAMVDNTKTSKEMMLVAAAHLISPKCIGFLMGRADLEPKDRALNAKSRVLHYIDRIIERFEDKDKATPELYLLYSGTISAMMAMIEAQDEAAMSRVFGLQRLSELLTSVMPADGKVSSDSANDLLKSNYDVIDVTDVTDDSGIKPLGVVPTVNYLQGFTNLYNGNGFELPHDDEKTSDAEVQDLNDAIKEVETESNDVRNQIEESERQLDKTLPKSKTTIAMKVNDTMFNVPCSQLIANDFNDGRAKPGDLNGDCFSQIPTTTVKASLNTLELVAGLNEEVWQVMDEGSLTHFFENGLLSSVSRVKLSRIGREDPTVCEVFDDPEKIEAIKNLESLDAECIAMSPLWGALAHHIGRSGPSNVLSYLSGEHLSLENENYSNNVGFLANADLGPQQWQKIGAEGTGVCEMLTVDLIGETIKNWGENLDPQCITINPSLIAGVPKSKRSKYLPNILASKGILTSFDDVTFVIITEIATASDLKQIFEAGNHCETFSRNIPSIPKAKLPILLNYCPSAGLNHATDEQVAQIIQKNCEAIDISQPLSIGVDRFFQDIKSNCLRQLSNDVISSLNTSSAVHDVIGRLSKEQLNELTGETIVNGLKYLASGQFSMLADHHVEAIKNDEEALAYYQQKMGTGTAAAAATA